MTVGPSGPRPESGYVMAPLEFEVVKWKDHAQLVEAECKAMLRNSQIKLDEEKAKYIDLHQRHKRLRREAIAMSEEHTEYESIIRRGQGKTISEVLDKVDELYAACLEEKERSGPDSVEFLEVLRNLKDAIFLYRVVSKRRPEVRQFLSEEVGVSTAATATRHDWEEFERALDGGRRGHQPASVPVNRQIASSSTSAPRRQRPVSPRSRIPPRSRAPPRPRAPPRQGSTSGFQQQQEPPRLNLDEILNLPLEDEPSSPILPPTAGSTVENWLSFSLRRSRRSQ